MLKDKLPKANYRKNRRKSFEDSDIKAIKESLEESLVNSPKRNESKNKKNDSSYKKSRIMSAGNKRPT